MFNPFSLSWKSFDLWDWAESRGTITPTQTPAQQPDGGRTVSIVQDSGVENLTLNMKLTMKKVNILVILFSFVFFNCQNKSILKDDRIENKAVTEEKTFPSYLEGEWAVNCGNGLTTFSINKDEGLISLYGNSIYIKVQVEKRSENEYILKFKQIADQKDWVDTSLRITESEISRDKIIGKFFIKKDGKVELHWEGLYNIKKQKKDYTGGDFSLIRESDGRNPILLEKC